MGWIDDLDDDGDLFHPERAYFERSGPRPAPPEPVTLSAEHIHRAERLDKADEAARAASSAWASDAIEACPLERRHVIQVRVVGEDGVPLGDVDVELRRSEVEAGIRSTSADGQVAFEGLEASSYQLGFPGLDRDAWAIDGSEPLLDAEAWSAAQAVWASPASVERPAVRHVVEQGECVSTLAFAHGLFPDTIWNDGDNAALKQRRKIRNVLFPGDVVHLPALRPGSARVDVGQRYVVRRRGVPEMLRIRFLDADGHARAGVPCLLALESVDDDETRLVTTNAEGFVIEHVRPDATLVTLTIGQGDAREIHQFRPASLDPIDTIAGVQKRLRSLGYDCGKDDGRLGGMTGRALRDFQRDNGLPVTSMIDDATRARLASDYLA